MCRYPKEDMMIRKVFNLWFIVGNSKAYFFVVIKFTGFLKKIMCMPDNGCLAMNLVFEEILHVEALILVKPSMNFPHIL